MVVPVFPDPDPGQAAVAEAEEAAFGGTTLDAPSTREELTASVNRLVAGEWWRANGPPVHVVAPRRSTRSSTARRCGDGVEIRLAAEQLTTATAAHELAHALAGIGHGHDATFRAAHADVVAVLAGRAAADRLTEAYLAFGLAVAERRWSAPWRVGGIGFRVVP
jgi:hypothetical protein